MKTYLKIIKRRFRSNRLVKIITTLIAFIILLAYMSRMSTFINEEIDLLTSDDNKRRYIMYRCDKELDKNLCGGFGDRLKGILSTYLWSLLTDRTFLLRITKPCNMTTLLEPNEVKWNKDVNQTRWWHTAELHKNNNDLFKQSLKTINLLDIKRTKQLLILHSNRNYFETIAENPMYTKKLIELGFDPDRLDLPYTFRTVYNKLFKLSPHMQRKYDEFVKKVRPNPNTKLICAQVRIGSSRFINGSDKRIDKDIFFQPISNSKKYINLIRSKFITNDTGENYKVFLTTDNLLVYEDFLKHFGPNKLIHNEGPFNHIDFIEFSKDVNDCSSIEKSILDFHCLAECDAAVISRSQFGRMGIWRRRDPIKDVYAYNSDLDDLVKIESMKQYKVH